MNKIGENQCKDILDSFAWDSTGYEESSGIRAREREDSHVFYFRDWFNIVTKQGWIAERHRLRTYQRGFGPNINKIDEPGNVSLCLFDRERLASLLWEDQPRYWSDFFDHQKYTRKQREDVLLDYITSLGYSNSLLKEFLDKYFVIEMYSKKDSEQFLAKCYERNERIYSEKQQFKANDVKKSEILTKSSIEERLIAKQIKKQTYLGEEHARESLYGTIEECLASGEELIIDEGKSKEAQTVIDYLKYLEIERKIINLQQQCVDLSDEEKSVNAEIISLQDKITGLRTQQTTLQEKQKGLQAQQKELQESQDELLM